MARNIFSNITARGTQAKFAEALATVPSIWDKFTQEIPSDAPDETHVWLGMLPQPREFLSGRSFQGFRDFTYNVANKEYELSFIIDQNTVEDDRHGLIAKRISDAANAWATYKDVLFAALCNNGGSTGYNSYDGVTFFNDSHVIGAATPDNNLTDDIVAAATPTVAEMKSLIRQMMLFLQGAQDDRGQEGYNWPAMSKLLVMGSQNYEQTMKETINAALTGGGDSNPYFMNLADPVVNPFLGTTNAYMYMAAVGDPNRMPFIFQKRTELDIQVLNGADDVAVNHGVLVLARQRFRLWYGEPRRMVLMAITTT
jgi:hypothetical protein